jgi:branched-chain amino acid transport system substrate-binding protein
MQDDEAGKALASGFVQTLAKQGVKPTSEQTYQVTDPSIDSQILQLKGAGVDTVFLVTVPRMTALAMRKIAALDWKPTIYVSGAGSSVKAGLEPAGLNNAVGVMTSAYRKSVADPRWESDSAVKDYRAFLTKYLPTADPNDELPANGYDVGHATHQILKMAGDDLTRANIMKIVSNLKDFRTPLLLPGVSFNTTPDDYQGFRKLQMSRFNGKTYEPFGELVSAP